MTYYDILKVKSNISQDGLKKQYRELVKTKHPDRGGSAAEFQRITEAYQFLLDENRRAAYDIKLATEKHAELVKRRAYENALNEEKQLQESQRTAVNYLAKNKSRIRVEYKQNMVSRILLLIILGTILEAIVASIRFSVSINLIKSIPIQKIQIAVYVILQITATLYLFRINATPPIRRRLVNKFMHIVKFVKNLR